MAEIVAFLSALPKLFELLRILEKRLGPDWPKKIAEINEAYTSLENAKNDAEADLALKRVAKSWSS